MKSTTASRAATVKASSSSIGRPLSRVRSARSGRQWASAFFVASEPRVEIASLYRVYEYTIERVCSASACRCGGFLGVHVFRNSGGRRHGQPVGFKTVDMEADRIPNLRFDLRNRRAGRDTSWQVWYVSRVVVVGLFDHDRVPHHFRSLSPACSSTLFSVPGAISSDGLPAIVTQPSLDACLYCRCDPRVAIRNQPSFSTRRITSRTFTPDHPEDYHLHSTVGAFKSQLRARADLGRHRGPPSLLSPPPRPI